VSKLRGLDKLTGMSVMYIDHFQ